MVHAGALPGTPRASASIDELVRHAVDEALILGEAGFDAVLVENMHDRPYVHGRKGPEITAAMTRIGQEVRRACGLPTGLQILSGGNHEALAVALAVGAAFIRCENFVFAHVADEGLLACAEAGPLLRYRRQIGADQVGIFADLKKKHAAHAITADVSLGEAAQAAEFFGADGVIVTGQWTGTPTNPAQVAEVRHATGLPVIVGSGVTPAQVGALFATSDALIVGSFIKREGVWSNPIDPARCKELVAEANRNRK
jgi:membrane complex biogenesis BtpA family protein